jgi:hypothetical protein
VRIFISTKETQGQRASDFTWTEDGELLRFGLECDCDKHPDGGCGCRRSLVGVTSQKSTTTFQVIDSDLTRAEFTEEIRKSLEGGGWLRSDDGNEWPEGDAAELLKLAAHFDTGMIIEKRGNAFQEREVTR